MRVTTRRPRWRTTTRGVIGALAVYGMFFADAAAAEIDCPSGTELRGRPQHKEWCETPDGVQHGPSIRYYQDGTRQAEAHFDHGTLGGSYREWHPNDQVVVEVRYKDGEKDGIERTFYADGTLRTEARYRNGKFEGEYKEFFENGKPMSVRRYTDGKLEGEAAAWYSGGQKRSVGRFSDGQYDGAWIGWYDDGSIEKEAVFEKGVEESRTTYARGEKR